MEEIETIPVNESNETNELNEINESNDILSVIEEKKEIPAETIEIQKKDIIPYLKPQESKYWRFTFKKDEDTNRLKEIIKGLGDGLTVNFETKQETPDIVIKLDNNIIGKINLLLCDRRDANLPEKYYCKLHFFHFTNQVFYDKVRNAVIHFFQNFKQDTSNMKIIKGGKKKYTIKRGKRKIHYRTYKQKRVKKTAKRK